MAFWMNRAGRHGEYESSFLDSGRIYLQWLEIDRDLSGMNDKGELREFLTQTYPSAPEGRLRGFVGQIWSFAKGMKPGDWVGMPSKTKHVIHVGEIVGPYEFDSKAAPDLRHSHRVKWFATDIPRSNFGQDILYKFAPLTICRIDAEDRIRLMAKNGWKPEGSALKSTAALVEDLEAEAPGVGADFEAPALDEIAKLISRKFKGHGMAWLVEKVLQAKGYTTFRSPEGPDFGIDIMAAPGSLGFGQPRIVVQVKSGDTPIDRASVDQLIGTMQNVHAEQGLYVSWGGFKSSVERETARQFFRVRLWDRQKLMEELLENYEELAEELRVELPLKRIWTVIHEQVEDDQ
jgi:restriction system protein